MKKWLLKQHPVTGLILSLLMFMGLIAFLWTAFWLVGLSFSALLDIELNVIQASNAGIITFLTLAFTYSYTKRIWKWSASVELWISLILPAIVVVIWGFVLVLPVLR